MLRQNNDLPKIDAPRHDREIEKDLKTLARFIDVYCEQHHADRTREPVTLKTHNVPAVAGREIILCADCRKLLAHAFVKRTACPHDPKPMCKKCPSHCYAPKYQEQIRKVMAFSGRHLALRGRLDYLLHLIR